MKYRRILALHARPPVKTRRLFHFGGEVFGVFQSQLELAASPLLFSIVRPSTHCNLFCLLQHLQRSRSFHINVCSGATRRERSFRLAAGQPEFLRVKSLFRVLSRRSVGRARNIVWCTVVAKRERMATSLKVFSGSIEHESYSAISILSSEER